ncbi:Uncharacterised protein [Mycobacteroides abscessus]|nr:Uncharacterised protein [Mycobacteroides abscessus]
MSGSPRSARISRERCWTSGVRASSSNRRESIEMGNAAARTWRSRPSSPGTVMIGPRVVWARSRRTARMKFAASPARWKPTRSAPSRPSITWRRHGSCWNSSSGGNGMWLKNPIRTSGRWARIICGTSWSW